MSDRHRLAAPAVDVHAHFALPGTETGPTAGWRPDTAVDFMDAHGIQLQLLSFPAALRPDEARRFNDYAAWVVNERAARFGMLACLPLADVDAALHEIDHAFDDLHADGVVLVTNYGGRYLGDPGFAPVFAELERHRAGVLVHPVAPPNLDVVGCGRAPALFEFPVETARTAVDALYGGVFDTYRGVRFVLAHAGGVLPTLAPRVASLGEHLRVPNPHGLTPDRVRSLLRGLYYDTAIAGTAGSIAPVLEVTGGDHLVYGSDFPPAGQPAIDAAIDALNASMLLGRTEVAAVARNALAVFPAVRQRVVHLTVDTTAGGSEG